jgi:hypothetical protein
MFQLRSKRTATAGQPEFDQVCLRLRQRKHQCPQDLDQRSFLHKESTFFGNVNTLEQRRLCNSTKFVQICKYD